MKLKILEVNMSRKNDANKYWIYGEDAALAARFTKYLTKVLYARRASYIRDKMVEVSREISIEDCSGEVDDVYGGSPPRLRNVSKPS